jgi:hypothetical protein
MTLDAKLRWKVHVQKKKRIAWSKIQKHVLAYGKTIGHVNTQQAGALQTETVTAEIRRFARKHEWRLLRHDNVEAIQLLDSSGLLRRLRRTKPFELVP